MAPATTRRSVADRIAALAAGVSGDALPVRLRAWDGSEAGPVAGPVLVLNSRRALRRLLWSPSGLGLSEAYIAGDLDIEGDLARGLSALWTAGRSGAVVLPHVPPAQWPQLLTTVARLGGLGRRPPAPGATGAAFHEESKEFYELLLDPSMTYSCGYFVDGPAGGLAAAQQAKLELVCRKLGLQHGDRHLDIGCGWGSLICYAAEHYGARSTGITRSRQQYDYVSKRIADAGLADRVQLRLGDYRELGAGADGGQFDAVSAIELGEQVGDADYPAFAGLLHRVLRPGGRALVQQRSRAENALGHAFPETYLAADLHLRPVAAAVSLLGVAGLEVTQVQSLREHYDWTASAWADRLETSWNGAVDLIGEAGARAWRLYLVGGALGFAEDRMGVEQILAARPALR